MGSRKTVPPLRVSLAKLGIAKKDAYRMFLIVPFGDSHTCNCQFLKRVFVCSFGVLFLRLNSFTLASSGVIVAHLTPTEYFLIASAESTVTWSFVSSR